MCRDHDRGDSVLKIAGSHVTNGVWGWNPAVDCWGEWPGAEMVVFVGEWTGKKGCSGHVGGEFGQENEV